MAASRHWARFLSSLLAPHFPLSGRRLTALLLPFLVLSLVFSGAHSTPDLPSCSFEGLPFVSNVSDMLSRDYGRPGLSHISVSSKVHHGNSKVDVWLQTFAPGTMTPIHRHNCEEVFVVLKGSGLLLRSRQLPLSEQDGTAPGEPEETTFRADSTFSIPPNQVHQIKNSFSDEDLQLYVFLSKPPADICMYRGWKHPHGKCARVFPYLWDQSCQ